MGLFKKEEKMTREQIVGLEENIIKIQDQILENELSVVVNGNIVTSELIAKSVAHIVRECVLLKDFEGMEHATTLGRSLKNSLPTEMPIEEQGKLLFVLANNNIELVTRFNKIKREDISAEISLISSTLFALLETGERFGEAVDASVEYAKSTLNEM